MVSGLLRHVPFQLPELSKDWCAMSQSLDVLGVTEKKNAVFSLKVKKLRYMRASFISMNSCDI